MSFVVEGANGTITVPGAVLAGIAARAAETVDGVHVRRRRADVEARTVTLGLSSQRGEPLTAVGERVQERVAAAFLTMCGLDVTVDVAIEELA